MDNPEKQGRQGTQHEEKQNKNTTQYVLDIHTRKQIHINRGKDELNIVLHAEIITDHDRHQNKEYC